jgi:phosphoglycolate phosphatase-like HAD superfamily hydrolase
MMMRDTLDGLIHKTKNPVAIFDLDGTVFDVTYRSMEIVRRFVSQPETRERFPVQAAAADKLGHGDYLYSLDASLANAGIDHYSEHAAEFLRAAENYWYDCFFTDEYLAFDRPYPGAVECVKFLQSNGVHIAYLSGRDIPNMSKGTIESLERYGLPHTGDGVMICLKPAYGQDDVLFKRQSLESIRRYGEIIATFDNEPANVGMFLEEFPDAMNFHFDTHYAKKLELKGPNFFVIKSFGELGF